jgi:hypothetical protein
VKRVPRDVRAPSRPTAVLCVTGESDVNQPLNDVWIDVFVREQAEVAELHSATSW